MGLFCYLVWGIFCNKTYFALKIKYLLPIMALVLWSCSQNTPKKRESVDQKSESIKQWIAFARDSAHLPLEERKQFLQNAQQVVSTLKNDTLIINHLSNISLAYMSLPDSLEFRKTNKQVMELAKKEKQYTALGNSHWDMAEFFQSRGSLDSAFYHYQNALKSFESLPVDSTSNSLKGRMLYNMGRIQDSYKDYLGAETSVTSAIKYFNELKDIRRLYLSYNVLGIIASGMGNSDKSLEYFQRGNTYINQMQSADRIKYTEQSQNNIAHEFLKKEDYRRAKIAFGDLLQSKDIFTRNPELYSMSLSSQAYAIYKDEKNLDTAKELLSQAIKINDSIAYTVDQPRAKQFYAEILADQGDTASALLYAKESRSMAKETYNNDRLLEVLRLLTKLDSNNAASYSNEYYDLNETLKEEERTKRDKFARIRMETDEIIQENEVLTREKELWAAFALIFIGLGTAGLVIINQQIRNNKLKNKQKQHESNQEIYNLLLSQQGKIEEGKQMEQKRISEELHDGVLGEMLGIRLILSGLNEKEDGDSVEKRAEFLERLRDVEEEIRTISHELNHAAYEKFHNFIVSLEGFIENLEQSSDIECSFAYDNEVNWDGLLGDIKINAIRIVQEALKNCVTHAKCKTASVALDVQGNKLKIVIADDGVGFDTKRNRRGIGLRNIASRVKKLKGTLDIESSKGKGTTIVATIPCKYTETVPRKGDSDQRETINA